MRSLSSFATLLGILTRAFLLEEDLHLESETLLQAIKDHQSSFTSLKKSRDEAKSEWWNPRIQHPSDAYDAAVDSMTRLAQHLSGLRSGLRLEVETSLIGNEQRGESTDMDDETRNVVLEKEFSQVVNGLGPPMIALSVSEYCPLFSAGAYESLERSQLASEPLQHYENHLASTSSRLQTKKASIITNCSLK